MSLSDYIVKEWPGHGVLYCGDALELLPQIESGSIDMIWTDPPFGHGNQDGDLQAARVRDGVKGGRVRDSEPIANDSGHDFERVMIGWMDEAKRILNRDCCCCCCCGGGGPTPTFARVSNWLDERLEFFHAVVWDKSARGNGMGWRYRRNYEFVMVSHRKGGRLLWANDGNAVPNVTRYMPVIDRVHPNEKPVAMVRDFIEWHTTERQLICDPFAGSGTTGVACIQTDRRFILCELEKHWCAESVSRIDRELAQPRLPFPEPVKETQKEIF